MSDQVLESFWVNVVAGIALLAGVYLVQLLCVRLGQRDPNRRISTLVCVVLCWLVFNVAYVYYFPKFSVVFVFVSCCVFAWIAWSELRQFWRIGLVGADAQIRSGLDFEKALSLVSNSLDFLGIGAAKMTAEGAAFESAIERCQRPERPVRFLLCRPDHEGLAEMARSASADNDQHSYQKRVQSSLVEHKGLFDGFLLFADNFPHLNTFRVERNYEAVKQPLNGSGHGSDTSRLTV